MDTYSGILSDIGNRIQNPSSDVKTILKTMVNAHYERAWNRYPWPEICVWDQAVTTTAGSADLVLPKDVGVVLGLSDRTNAIALTGTAGQQMVRGNVSTIAITGTPYEYSDAGEVGALNQPNVTSASAIKCISSAAADATQTVTIWGIVSGERQSYTVTLSGVSSATTSGVFSSVERIGVSAATAGVLTFTANAGTVAVATLAPNERYTRYLKLRLHYVPSTAATIYVSYKRRFAPLVNDNDYPEINVSQFLVLQAEADWLERQGQFSKAQAMRQEAGGALRDAVVSKAVHSDKFAGTIPLYGRSSIDQPMGY